MAFKLSRAAEEDLIQAYVEGAGRFGGAQADAYYDDLIQTCQFLADNPRAAPVRAEIAPEIRVHPHREHLIIYTLDTRGDVFVIRVRHRREDWL